VIAVNDNHGHPPAFLDVWQVKDLRASLFACVAAKGVSGRGGRRCVDEKIASRPPTPGGHADIYPKRKELREKQFVRPLKQGATNWDFWLSKSGRLCWNGTVVENQRRTAKAWRGDDWNLRGKPTGDWAITVYFKWVVELGKLVGGTKDRHWPKTWEKKA